MMGLAGLLFEVVVLIVGLQELRRRVPYAELGGSMGFLRGIVLVKRILKFASLLS